MRLLIPFFAIALTLSEAIAKDPAPKVAPAPPMDAALVDAAIEHGITFLLNRQNKDGSWGTPKQTKDLNIYAPGPGSHLAFRSAITAMCVKALIDCGPTEHTLPALGKAETWLFENLPKLRRADGTAIYNVWGHIYSIEAFATMLARPGTDEAKKTRIKEAIAIQIDLLQRYESVDGGWGYYDMRYQTKKPSSSSISFVNAAGLVALKAAQNAGAKIPDKLAQRALDAIQRQRKPDNTYTYGEYLKMKPMRGINRAGGSLGRSQACNIALKMWGDETITSEVLDQWLDRLFSRNGWLDIGRKRPVPHEAWFQVAGYFYYFGHYYAGHCIAALDDETAAPHKDHMAATLLSLQEKDGSWWDFPFYDYHQQYGTAFVLQTLSLIKK
jgi:hypothetical protein